MLNLKTIIKSISVIGGLMCLLMLIFVASSFAEDLDAHNCVLYGILSTDAAPDGMMVNSLLTDSKSIRYGRQQNGWGIAWYPDWGAQPSFDRSAEKPIDDGQWCDFDGTCVPAGEYARLAAYLDTTKPKIVLVHWRTGSSGCGGYVADPHPFYRTYDGKVWSFIQNGGSSKERGRRLIVDGNPDPLNNDWMNDLPDSAGVLGCYPQHEWKYPGPWEVGDISLMVDSELEFLLIMKHIKEAHAAGKSTLSGIATALMRFFDAGETGGLNFIMSDGYTMWAFKRGNYLNYRYDAAKGFTDVSTMALTGVDINGNLTGFDNDGWIAMGEYQIVVAERGAPPKVYDVRDLIPGNLNHDLYVDGKDEAIVLGAPKSCKGDPNYVAAVDFNGNGCVNQRDVQAWYKYYGEFVDTVLCDDHSDTPTGCCRDFAYCGATYLTLNGSAGTIELGGDVDYFQFAAMEGIAYTIKVDSIQTATLRLYDKDEVLLASGSGTPRQIDWTCPMSGTYYVRVNLSASRSDYYTLSLSVPSFTPVEIKIPSCINNTGQGVIVVTIQGVDPTQIDPSSIRLNGLGVQADKNGKLQAHIAANKLVVQIENKPWAFKQTPQGATEAELTAELYDGTLIRGITSCFCIIP